MARKLAAVAYRPGRAAGGVTWEPSGLSAGCPHCPEADSDQHRSQRNATHTLLPVRRYAHPEVASILNTVPGIPKALSAFRRRDCFAPPPICRAKRIHRRGDLVVLHCYTTIDNLENQLDDVGRAKRLLPAAKRVRPQQLAQHASRMRVGWY